MLYLDSIDTGRLKWDHGIIPRIMFFGHEVMKSMTLADMADDELLECQFGKSQVLYLAEV